MFRFLRTIKVAAHLVLVFAAFIAAYEVRRALPLSWWFSNPLAISVFVWGGLYTAVAGVVEGFLRTERASWRYASVREVIRLALACALTAAVFIVVMFLTSRAHALPRSTFVLAGVFSLLFLVGIRMAWRLRFNPGLAFGDIFGPKSDGAPLTLVGNIAHAETYLRGWNAGVDPEYRPVAILTNERYGVGQLIHGVPVLGDVQTLSRRTGNRTNVPAGAILFLDDPITGLGLTTTDIGRLRGDGRRLLRQASSVELRTTQAGKSLREMKLEEFLPRAPLRLDTSPLAALVSGRRVLVTGAAGSIGSEISRQLLRFGCAHITLVDHSEFGLFEIDRELERVTPEGATRSAILCNVRDEARVKDVFSSERPDIVFHAAALKHVTLVELNPSEGVLTNVLGTWNVAMAAKSVGARDMVMISTDKAVDPSNVMGATKRIAESLLQAHAFGETRFSVVRFGNVLGSAGSVVPIFRDQIERGGPVTVTHPDVTRFFMTIPEAVQLVLHATALRRSDAPGAGLRKFVLEMGEPVKILDLAKQMVQLSGGPDMKIQITGLRPGEKMAEELIDSDEQASRCAEGITEIKTSLSAPVIGRYEVNSLVDLAIGGSHAEIRIALFALLNLVRWAPTQRPRLVSSVR